VPNDAVQEHGTYWGDEGRAVRRGGSPTALLSVGLGQRSRYLEIGKRHRLTAGWVWAEDAQTFVGFP
jgi:hypothetical protein